jgi:uncharacterized membrane protein
MTFTWLIPVSFNIAFGETTALFGLLFVATSLSLEWVGSYLLGAFMDSLQELYRL